MSEEKIEVQMESQEKKFRLVLLKMPEEVFGEVATVLKKNGLPVPKTDFNVYKWVNVEKFMQRLSEQMFIKAMLVGSRRCGITFKDNVLKVENEIGQVFISRLEKQSFYQREERNIETQIVKHPSYFDKEPLNEEEDTLPF